MFTLLAALPTEIGGLYASGCCFVGMIVGQWLGRDHHKNATKTRLNALVAAGRLDRDLANEILGVAPVPAKQPADREV